MNVYSAFLGKVNGDKEIYNAFNDNAFGFSEKYLTFYLNKRFYIKEQFTWDEIK